MSYEEWEKRQQANGRPSRRRPARALKQSTVLSRTPPPVDVVMPQRTFAEWVIAGIGISVGMLILSIAATVLLVPFSVCTGNWLLESLVR